MAPASAAGRLTQAGILCVSLHTSLFCPHHNPPGKSGIIPTVQTGLEKLGGELDAT